LDIYGIYMAAEHAGTQSLRGRRPASGNRIAPEIPATTEMSDEQKEEMELLAKAKMEELGQKKAWAMMKRRVLNFLEDQVIQFLAVSVALCQNSSDRSWDTGFYRYHDRCHDLLTVWNRCLGGCRPSSHQV
jgi:hypothetical protein